VKLLETKRERWVLFAAVVLSLCYVFLPGIRWVASVALRSNPVRAGHIQVELPRSWGILASPDVIIARTPVCITQVCAGASPAPQSAMEITWVPLPGNAEELVTEAETRSMEQDGYVNRRLQVFHGAEGPMTCIEAKKEQMKEVVRCYCRASAPGLSAKFTGDSVHIGAFYSAVRSVRIVR